MTIATQADVEAVLTRPLTTAEEAYIDELLAKADAMIYAELPGVRFVSVLTNQTATIAGSGTFEIWLPGTPVVNIDSLTLDGSALTDRVHFTWHRFGDVHRIGLNWPLTSTIQVQWDYGMSAPPGDIVAVAADLASRGLSNPTAVRSETVGQYSVSYAVAVMSTLDLSSYEATFNHYRYPVPV